MNSSALIAIELVFVLGAALTWGCWELYSLKREKKRAEQEASERGKAPVGPAPGEPD